MYDYPKDWYNYTDIYPIASNWYSNPFFPTLPQAFLEANPQYKPPADATVVKRNKKVNFVPVTEQLSDEINGVEEFCNNSSDSDGSGTLIFLIALVLFGALLYKYRNKSY
jgi:hypothetical protein